MRSRTAFRAVSAALLVVVVAALWGTHQDAAHAFWKTLAGLPVPAILGALVLILVQVNAQGLRLWAILPRETSLSAGRVVGAFTAGEWANIFTPARAGDALKVVLMSRLPGARRISVLQATGAVVADKIIDIGSLALLCAIAGLLGLVWTGVGPRLPALPLAAVAGGMLVLMLVGLRLAPAKWFGGWRAAGRELLRGLSALKDPVRCAASLALSSGAWIAELLAARVLCAGLGFPLSLPQALFAIAILNVGILVPVVVANAGMYEAAFAYGLSRSGVPVPSAIAIAAAHHVLELLGLSLSAAAFALAFHAPPWLHLPLFRRRTPCASSIPSARS